MGDVIEGNGNIIMPGFINTHCHLAMTLFRGYGENSNFTNWWLDYMRPLEDKLQPKDCYYGATLGILELLKNGVTTVADFYLHGEETAVQTCDKYYITRTSWLYGHHGKNFVETMISLKDKEELKVVDDQVGCPTWTVELANGIVQILLEEMPYGIYQVCGSGSTSWYGFAKKIFELCGFDVNLKPCTTEEFPRPAKRPKNSIMENNKLCRNWEVALKEYLELRCE